MEEFYNYKGGEVRFLPPQILNKYYFFNKDTSSVVTEHGSCLVQEAIKSLKLFMRSSDRKDKINKILNG